MNIFLLIYIPLLFFALKNYRRAFLLYAAMRLFLSIFVPFWSVPGLPLLQLETFMNFAFLCLLGIAIQQGKQVDFQSFPLKWPFVLCAVSILLPCFNSSVAPLGTSLVRGCRQVLDTFVFTFLVWQNLRTKNDIRFLLYALTIVLSVVVCYGIFERMNHFENPLLSYEMSLNPNMEVTWNYSEEDSRGGRVRSVFAHAIGCGGYMALSIAFFYHIRSKYKKLWNVPYWFMGLFFMGMLLVLLFSNSRGPVLCLGIVMLFLLKMRTGILLACLFPLVALLFYDSLAPYFQMVSSLWNASAAEEMNGSSFALRIAQYAIALSIWLGHPWIGDGPKATDYWMENRPELMGAESVWIGILLNQGVLGAISHAYLLISLAKLASAKTKRFFYGIVLAWAVFTTATVAPGLDISYLMMLLVIAWKLDQLSLPQQKRIAV
jgi:hypothetical protein